MAKIAQLEVNSRAEQLTADVQGLIEKYRSNFEWDVSEADQGVSDKIIVSAIRDALDDIERTLSPPSGP